MYLYPYIVSYVVFLLLLLLFLLYVALRRCVCGNFKKSFHIRAKYVHKNIYIYINYIFIVFFLFCLLLFQLLYMLRNQRPVFVKIGGHWGLPANQKQIKRGAKAKKKKTTKPFADYFLIRSSSCRFGVSILFFVFFFFRFLFFVALVTFAISRVCVWLYIYVQVYVRVCVCVGVGSSSLRSFLSTEIVNVECVQFGARSILEQGGTILALSLLHPMTIDAEGATIDNL